LLWTEREVAKLVRGRQESLDKTLTFLPGDLEVLGDKTEGVNVALGQGEIYLGTVLE
jgi:hypothetical protein